MKLLLTKMKTQMGNQIDYFFECPEKDIHVNTYIGKQISLKWNGRIECSKCLKQTDKSFGQGFCYSCFISAPEASPCILHPELCEAHLGKGRDIEYELKYHNQPHIVYLAATDIVKVGVTKISQVPTRWIDQGANKAIILAEVPNRYLAGKIEVALKDHFSDKTNWQSMLCNLQDETINLENEKWRIHEILPSDLTCYWSEDDSIHTFNYPVEIYPTKLASLTFDKTPEINGMLKGIKGQYLLFEDGQVLNIRRHTSYQIEFDEIS